MLLTCFTLTKRFYDHCYVLRNRFHAGLVKIMHHLFGYFIFFFYADPSAPLSAKMIIYIGLFIRVPRAKRFNIKLTEQRGAGEPYWFRAKLVNQGGYFFGAKRPFSLASMSGFVPSSNFGGDWTAAYASADINLKTEFTQQIVCRIWKRHWSVESFWRARDRSIFAKTLALYITHIYAKLNALNF